MAEIIRTGIPDLLPVRRKPGLHVSDIINYICLKRGIYDEGPANMTRLQLGLAFEHALKERYRLDNPGRYREMLLQKNKIHMSLDLYDLWEFGPDEIKLTWMSSRHEFDSKKFWKYLIQLMAYCFGSSDQVGRLHVCNINGDYEYGTPGADPQYTVYRENWTRRAIYRNWDMMLSNADDAWKYKQGLITL